MLTSTLPNMFSPSVHIFTLCYLPFQVLLLLLLVSILLYLVQNTTIPCFLDIEI